jgi:hypothetical protein
MATGRPRLPKDQKLSKKLVVSVDNDLYKRTRVAASKMSMQLSDYLRHAVIIANTSIIGPEADGVDPMTRMKEMMKNLIEKADS